MPYAYATNLWRLDFKDPVAEKTTSDTAAAMVLYGMLMIRVDSARCADQTAPMNKILTLNTEYEEILNYIKRLSPRERVRSASIAVGLEERNRGRVRDAWLCSGGLDAISEYLKRHPQPTGNEQWLDDPGSLGGKTLILPTGEIPPQFIDDAEWEKARLSIINGFKQQFMQ
jgi:hypothetical protein